MEVIGHNHKFMQEQVFLAAMVLEDIQQELCRTFGLENRSPSVGHGRDEEGPNLLRRKGHDEPGLKAAMVAGCTFRGLGGPDLGLKSEASSHGPDGENRSPSVGHGR